MAKIRNLGNISKGLSQQRLSTKEGRRQRSESIQSSTTPDPGHHIQPYQPMFPLRADQELYYSVPEHLVNSKSYGSVLQRCVINKYIPMYRLWPSITQIMDKLTVIPFSLSSFATISIRKRESWLYSSFHVCVFPCLCSNVSSLWCHRLVCAQDYDISWSYLNFYCHFLINTVLQFGNTLILSRQPIGMVLMCTIICAIF